VSAIVAIGTAKGLFVATSPDRERWQLAGPYHPMNAVYAVAVDTRRGTPRLLASVTSSHFGPSVAVSDDLGQTWTEPDHAPVAFPERTGEALRRVWQLAPGPADQPDRVYAGTEPSALFVSDDAGQTYRMVESLWDHPHREQWGAGFGGQAVHTVLPHPARPDEWLVAMSTGGVYRSEDAGASWAPANTGIKAYFFPDPWPEFGQCVHKVARDAVDPDRLYAQNHHGVYRSDDAGRSWTSIADGLPTDFGFTMVAHPRVGGTIWSFPVEADGVRFPPDRLCRVFRSRDAGATWEACAEGLPGGPYYPIVLRDAMCADDGEPAGVYFGTRAGDVYASADEGEHWGTVASHLPDVLSIRAAVL
jgi:hypothetical protein